MTSVEKSESKMKKTTGTKKKLHISRDPVVKEAPLEPLMDGMLSLFDTHVNRFIAVLARRHFDNNPDSVNFLLDMLKSSLTYSLEKGCVYILKKGKRKNEPCGGEIKEHNFCSVHADLILDDAYKRVLKSAAKPKTAVPGLKKPLSSYFLFAKDERPNVKKQFPDMPFGEVGRELGKRWKSLTPDKKAPYEQRAKELKEEYKLKLEGKIPIETDEENKQGNENENKNENENDE